MESHPDTSGYMLPLGLTWFLQIILACSVIAYLLQQWWNRKWTINEGELPPGSMGYFGIGETLQFAANMKQYIRKKDQKYGCVYKTHIIGSPTIRISGSDNVKHIFCDNRDVIEDKNAQSVLKLFGSSSFTGLSGKAHKNTRAHIMNAFKKNYLQHYIPRIYTIMERTLNEWCVEDRILVFKRAKLMALEAAWEVIVGLPVETEAELKNIAGELETLGSGLFSIPINLPGCPYYKALKAKQVLHSYIEKAIGLGESLSPNSVLGMMLQLKRDSGVEYSTEQIQDLATELLFAGEDTITSAVTSLIIRLSQSDDVRSRLLREIKENELLDKSSTLTYDCTTKMSYLNNVVKEVLRMHPPVSGVFRTAKRSFQLANYTIPKGWKLLTSITYTMEQADIENKDSFDPDRWQDKDQSTTDFDYIPFGAGPRMCVGREYAKVFLRVFAICLLQRCNVEVLSDDIEFVVTPTLRPKDYLPARFTYREFDSETVSSI